MGGLAPRFTRLERCALPFDAAGDVELAWLADALDGVARAVLWHTPPGLVAPMSYRRHPELDAVAADFAARGWPLRLRRSGGGVVPQGPGVLNLSLTYAVDGPPGAAAEAVYRHLAALLGAALDRLGIEAHAAEVAGSFCDGRYNLAVAHAGGARKIAGTAQYWKRSGARHAVLAHALLMVDADTDALTAVATAFEAALGSGRAYDAGVITSVARELAAPPAADLSDAVRDAIADALAMA